VCISWIIKWLIFRLVAEWHCCRYYVSLLITVEYICTESYFTNFGTTHLWCITDSILKNSTKECIVVLDSGWNVMAHSDARDVKWRGKLTNGVGSQYPSHYLGTWRIQHYYRWCAHLGCQQSTELTAPADLNGLVRFAERRNLVSARVPSRFNWPLP